jgi:hypothetical protein
VKVPIELMLATLTERRDFGDEWLLERKFDERCVAIPRGTQWNRPREPQAPSIAELSAPGVARVSWGPLLQWDAIARFQEQLASLRD